MHFADDPVLKVIEYIVMKDKLQNKATNVKLSQCLTSLLNWNVPDTSPTQLAESLLGKLMTSLKANEPKGKKIQNNVDRQL